jgi:hypothetical protein
MYRIICGMRSIAEWLERLIANAKVVKVMGSIPKSSDTVESGELCLNKYFLKKFKNPTLKVLTDHSN